MSQTQRTPHVRIAILSGFPAVAETLGFDAGVALTEAGIDSALLAEPDNRLPVARVSRLLADATKATGRRDIGLLLSQTVGFDRLGLTGLLACGRPTVAAAVQAIIGFSQLHNEALHMWVDPAGAQMLLREEYLTGPAG